MGAEPKMTASTLPLQQVRLHAIILEAEEVLSFELRPRPGDTLPDFTAGAHVDLHLPGGLVRQYSLTEVGDGRRYVLGVARDRASRGGSRWLHDQARVGHTLTISAPRNSFPLVEDAAFSVFVAGGIGITPILAMIRRLAALGRPWRLHYAVRTRTAAAFLEPLNALGGDLRLHVDDESGGLLDVAAVVRAAPTEAHLYACGPAPMIAAFEAAAAGRPDDHLHVEHFGPVLAPAGGEGFEVELARSGKLLRVGPAETILEVVLAAGVNAPSSCRNGVCGSCETRVLAGTPEHRDMILSPAERASGETMMICCSRASTPRLRLDL